MPLNGSIKILVQFGSLRVGNVFIWKFWGCLWLSTIFPRMKTLAEVAYVNPCQRLVTNVARFAMLGATWRECSNWGVARVLNEQSEMKCIYRKEQTQLWQHVPKWQRKWTEDMALMVTAVRVQTRMLQCILPRLQRREEGSNSSKVSAVVNLACYHFNYLNNCLTSYCIGKTLFIRL